MAKPIIAITMGDAAGIGAELVVKILANGSVGAQCRPVIIGDISVMEENRRRLGAPLSFRSISRIEEAAYSPAAVEVLCPAGAAIESIPWGTVNVATGKAAALCLQEAARLGMQRAIHGVLSAPLNKQAFHLAGYDYFDELALMADVTHSEDVHILGVTDSFFTVSVTEHIPFIDIAGRITKESVLRRTVSLNDALKRVGFATPHVAVAALNVHAGEGGMFGREEIDQIEPAITEAQRRGIDAHGPVPADTVFVRARAGEFDGVVTMYHDQANIARKLVSTLRGTTIFMGMPFITGTTAHGTAFDKAGKGVAETGSIEAALKYTVLMSANSSLISPTGNQTRAAR